MLKHRKFLGTLENAAVQGVPANESCRRLFHLTVLGLPCLHAPSCFMDEA